MSAVNKELSRDELILSSRSFARQVVKRLIKSMNLPADATDELYSAAELGLVEAAESYDVTKNSDFKCYAFFRIRGAIIDALREYSSISRRAYKYCKALEAMQDFRETSLYSTDNSNLKSGELETSDKILARVLEFASKGAIAFRLSLDDFEEEVTSHVGSMPNPEMQLETKQNQSLLRRIVATLPEKERLVLEGYYFKEKSFVEIAGDESGMSKSWVSRIHSRALKIVQEKYIQELKK